MKEEISRIRSPGRSETSGDDFKAGCQLLLSSTVSAVPSTTRLSSTYGFAGETDSHPLGVNGRPKASTQIAERLSLAMSSTYSFPVLSDADLLPCLKEMNLPLTAAQLSKPTYEIVKPVYENIVTSLMGVSRRVTTDTLISYEHPLVLFTG